MTGQPGTFTEVQVRRFHRAAMAPTVATKLAPYLQVELSGRPRRDAAGACRKDRSLRTRAPKARARADLRTSARAEPQAVRPGARAHPRDEKHRARRERSRPSPANPPSADRCRSPLRRGVPVRHVLVVAVHDDAELRIGADRAKPMRTLGDGDLMDSIRRPRDGREGRDVQRDLRRSAFVDQDLRIATNSDGPDVTGKSASSRWSQAALS